MTIDINNLIRAHSLNGGRIRIDSLCDKDKEIIIKYYDLAHDIVVPFFKVETESELTGRIQKLIPALEGDSISALLATIAYDYR